ncbi:MAG TPA: hypothetical protein VI698_03865 [Nitrososphaerales archaeon]|nr:hypothetical protein [Nitrososphaerales archaeon]
MNSSLILKAIPIINEGSLSFDDFALATGLGRKTSTELVRMLARNEIGYVDSDFVSFDQLDKMRTAMLALKMGVDVEDLSGILGWKDFELLATNILDASGYVAHHGFRLKKPRMEIDIVGIKDGMALLIDCKHWKRSSPSEMARFASMQVKRAEAFVRASKQVRFAVPAILTLHLESITFADDVPVIPIVKLRSFLNEVQGYLNEIKVVS